jgi:heme oxygenase
MSPSDPSSVPRRDEPGFAARLRDGTKAVHREAERSGFIAELIHGRATRDGYALFLRNMVPVYATLETAIDAHRHETLVAAFAMPGLRRLPHLVGDLEAIAGADWACAFPLLPEAEAYARAIETAAAADGARLAAHAYARYLGDLSGGQILRTLLARTLQLDPDMLAFYEFSEIDDPQVPKAAMRLALDALPPRSAGADALIAEAVAAFRHNIDLSLAVARAMAPAN